MQEENNRVQQLSQMIDKMVATTVVDTCKEKVYDAVIPMVKDHILKTYGPLPEIVEVHAGRNFLDELDASILEVLVILNAANRYFDFPTGKVTAHKNFRLIAAGNTTGTGSDSVYSGRYCLDGASLDRFAQIPYSEKIEKAVTMDDEKLIQFCHAYRKAVKDSGVNSIFSYRGLSNITSMKEDLPLEDLMRSCLTKGMTKDDLVVIKKSISMDDSENPYLKAFTNL